MNEKPKYRLQVQTPERVGNAFASCAGCAAWQNFKCLMQGNLMCMPNKIWVKVEKENVLGLANPRSPVEQEQV